MGKPTYRYNHEFEITNFTRYNTDDIGRLIEEAFARSGGFRKNYTYSKNDSTGAGEWVSRPRIPDQYIIKDYTGSEADVVKKPDRMVDDVQTLRFRPYTKLKVGNLEQLAIANSSEIPAPLVELAIQELGVLFQRPWPDDEREPSQVPPKLRIMAKRGQSISKAERQRVARERIVKHVTATEYRYDGMVVLNKKTLASVNDLIKARKRGKLPETQEEKELLRLAKLSIEISRQVTALLKSLPDAIERATTTDTTPNNPNNPKSEK